MGLGGRRLMSLAFFTLGTLATALPTALAYTGGPVTARLIGYDPTEAKVFYTISFHDESGSPDHAYYLDLDSSAPDTPIRAQSLEQEPGKRWSNERSKRWWDIQQRLLPLRAPQGFDYSVSVLAESLGVGSYMGADSTRYRIHVVLESPNGTAHLDTMAYCHPEVRVRGLYQIPGRQEQVVVVSVIGRLYGCEPTDVVLLVRKRQP